MTGASIHPLRIGDSATRARVFSGDDLAEYRSLSGDGGLGFGPGGREGVPGPLLAGMISDLLGTTLPGLGTMWLKQHLTYSGSAPLSAEVVAEVRITLLRPEKGLVDLATTCRIAGEVVVDGVALVMVPNLPERTRSD